MKKNFIFLGTLLVSGLALAQVGVNTNAPQATLDVVGKPTNASSLDGVIAPRITGVQLRAKTYTGSQEGALVYVTTADPAPAGQTVNVTNTGYYYFDGNLWQTVKASPSASPSTNIYNADGSIAGLETRRTLTLNGKELAFNGTQQRTFWSANGSINQSNEQSGTGNASISLYGGNDSNLRFQQFYNSNAIISIGGNSTSLDLATHKTAISAPITFSTSAGSSASASEKMRITGEGNIGVNTISPTEKFDNNGITRLRTLPLNGATNAINTTSTGDLSSTQNQTFTATKTVVADENGVLGYVTGLLPTTPTNIYTANGALTSARTLTQNGFGLTFLGTNQSTMFSSAGGIRQNGIAGSKRADLVLTANDNDSNSVSSSLNIFQDPESLGQVTVDKDSRGLSIGSSFTTQPAPITFQTAAGGNVSGFERMRITPTGNVGINTTTPTEKLHVSGITRLQGLPLNGTANAIYTTSTGTASGAQDQTFTATRTVVADANGVLGYVSGLPTGGGTPPSGSINVGETISQIYSIPAATTNSSAFNLGTYVTANSLPALPVIDGLQINLQGNSSSYYDPRIYNVSSASQLISYQSFATQVNQNRTSLNNTVAPAGYLQIDQDNLVYWTTTSAEVETANVQVQIDANTYRWYEFKWWCMEIGTGATASKKIFLSIIRKA